VRLFAARSAYEERIMSEGFWIVMFIIAGVVVYVVAQVLFYMRKSRQQWQEVDRSKLREWEDGDD
jgi:predicted membrane channel-forming protein YqfA (hemolysin III family)